MLKAHSGQKLFSFALACILSGAVGNVIDRVLYGYVVDFLDFHYANWHFPAFNIADSAITVGALRDEKESGAIYFRDQVMELTPRESALLQALMARPGHAVAKERLFELVFPGQDDVQYEAVEVVVYRLRKKLAATGTTLMTLRGLGYLLKAT